MGEQGGGGQGRGCGRGELGTLRGARGPHRAIAAMLFALGLLNPYREDLIVPMQPSTWARSRTIFLRIFSLTAHAVLPVGAMPTFFTPSFLAFFTFAAQ